MGFLKKLIIVTVITIAILAVFEITLRTLFPQDTIITYKKGTLGLVDQTLGHNNRPSSYTRFRTPEFNVDYKINEEGFRDAKNYSSLKDPDVSRILLLGDSFTFGVGSQYEDIWPVIFENNLIDKGYKVEIIKAGVPAYDTTKELLLLEKLYPEYKPDIVVMAFLTNDVFTNTPITKETDSKTDSTVKRKNEKKSSLNVLTLYKRILLSNDWIYSKLYMLSGRSDYFSSPPTKTLEKQLEVTKDLLMRAQEYCWERGMEFIVLSIPQQFQVIYKANGYNFENTDVLLIDERLGSFAEENGIVWISVLNQLVKYRNNNGHDLYYRFDGHLDKKGNKVVGDFFTESFIEITSDKLN